MWNAELCLNRTRILKVASFIQTTGRPLTPPSRHLVPRDHKVHRRSFKVAQHPRTVSRTTASENSQQPKAKPSDLGFPPLPAAERQTAIQRDK